MPHNWRLRAARLKPRPFKERFFCAGKNACTYLALVALLNSVEAKQMFAPEDGAPIAINVVI